MSFEKPLVRRLAAQAARIIIIVLALSPIGAVESQSTLR